MQTTALILDAIRHEFTTAASYYYGYPYAYRNGALSVPSRFPEGGISQMGLGWTPNWSCHYAGGDFFPTGSPSLRNSKAYRHIGTSPNPVGLPTIHGRTQPKIFGRAFRGSEGHPADDDDLASEKGHLLAKRALFSGLPGGGGSCPPSLGTALL